MKVTIITPDEYLGDIIGDVNSSPRSDPGDGEHPGATQITAMIPLAEMFGYAPNCVQNAGPRSVFYGAEPLCRGSKAFRKRSSSRKPGKSGSTNKNYF